MQPCEVVDRRDIGPALHRPIAAGDAPAVAEIIPELERDVERASRRRLPRARQGNLLIGSLKFELLVRLVLRNGRVVHEERLLDGIGDRIRDVEQGPDGSVFLLTDEGNGRILRIDPST